MEDGRPTGSRSGRPDARAAQRGWRDDLRRLSRDLVDTSPNTWVDVSVSRWVVLALTGVFALVLTVTGAETIAHWVRLPVMICVLLAVGKALPMPLAVVRPMLAWWWSLSAVVVYAVLIGVLPAWSRDAANWPPIHSALITHLVVTLVVAGQRRPLVVVAQWVGSVLVANVLQTVLTPNVPHIDLRLFVFLSLAGLALIGAVRALRGTRRQLRMQEALTDQERDRRALLEERSRIARELHDVVAHHMSLVAVQAEAAPYRVTDPPPELQESFASIRKNAVAALNEMRHILGMLRAEEPDSATSRYAPAPGLDNVGELLDNVRAAGLAVELISQGDARPLPTLVELSVFRIVQEALSNALRHAPGSRVRVELDYRPDAIEVRVANSIPADGRPAVTPPSSGHGLLGMRERASALGGALSVRSREDGWFEVAASIPCGDGEPA